MVVGGVLFADGVSPTKPGAGMDVPVVTLGDGMVGLSPNSASLLAAGEAKILDGIFVGASMVGDDGLVMIGDDDSRTDGSN